MTEWSRFRDHLTQLRKTVFDGVSYFIVWQALTVEYEGSLVIPMDHEDFWWRCRGFPAPTRNALLASALMQFAKAYDTHKRAVSLRRLLNTALAKPEDFTPYATASDLRDILDKIGSNTELLRRLKLQRNQRLAHIAADLVEDIVLPPEEVQVLAEETKSIYNSLWFSHEGKQDDFEDIMENVVLHTSQVIGSMKKTESYG